MKSYWLKEREQIWYVPVYMIPIKGHLFQVCWRLKAWVRPNKTEQYTFVHLIILHSFKNALSVFFSRNVSSLLLGIGLHQKLILCCKNWDHSHRWRIKMLQAWIKDSQQKVSSARGIIAITFKSLTKLFVFNIALWRYPLGPLNTSTSSNHFDLLGRWSTSGSDRRIAHFFIATRNTSKGVGGKRTN